MIGEIDPWTTKASMILISFHSLKTKEKTRLELTSSIWFYLNKIMYLMMFFETEIDFTLFVMIWADWF